MPLENSEERSRGREGVWDWLVRLELLWVVLAIFTVYLMVIEADGGSARGPMFFLSIWVAIWFLTSFAGDDEGLLRRAVRFSYIFTFGSFALVALAPAVSDKRDQHADGPIGIIRGCDARKDQGLKIETIACLDAAGERDEIPTNTADAQKTAAAADAAASELPARAILLLHIGGVTAVRKELAPDAIRADAANAKTDAKAFGVDPRAQQGVETPERNAEPPTPDTGVARQSDQTQAKDHYYVVQKGLIVPFYVVLLSLIGAAVSLSRRVPEIQKRVDDEYMGTATEPKLFAWEAREQLVFQVLQYLSAPFIAIAAYYIMKPTTVPAEVGLAFLSGFASETILLLIRGMLSGLRPQTATTFQKGTVHGHVKDAAGNAQSDVEVTILPKQAQESATTDAAGAFTFSDVPPGTYRLSTKDGYGTATATVTSGAIVNVEIRLKPST